MKAMSMRCVRGPRAGRWLALWLAIGAAVPPAGPALARPGAGRLPVQAQALDRAPALDQAPDPGPTPAPDIADLAQALAMLDRAEPVQRAAAVLWLAQHGADGDAARVAPRLHDAVPEIRALAEQALWLMWSRSGDADVDALLARGSDAMNRGELDRAIATFGDVVARRPGFAEGWNKRATARYLAGDFLNAMADCDEVLRRNPLHFGALSGYGLILSNLEEYERALGFFRRALAVNPGMDGVRANIAAVERLLDERRRRSTQAPDPAGPAAVG